LSKPAVVASIPVPGPASSPVPQDRVLVLGNRQKDRPLSLPILRRITLDLLEAMGLGAELGFHFVSAREMARVNWQFLGHEGSTDVITFDHGSNPDHLHGECFICVADAWPRRRNSGPPGLARWCATSSTESSTCGVTTTWNRSPGAS